MTGFFKCLPIFKEIDGAFAAILSGDPGYLAIKRTRLSKLLHRSRKMVQFLTFSQNSSI